MTKVFTGNVFLTTSKEVMEKVFFPKLKVVSYEDQLKTLSDEDIKKSIIASPKINSNLLELEYSYNKERGSSFQLTLRLLETNSYFEQYYMNKDILGSTLENIFDRIDNDKKIPLNKKASLKADLTLGGLNSHKVVYCAFGVGDDVSDWAGPIVCNLLDASLNIDDSGVRMIELIFIAEAGGFLRNDIELKNNLFFNNSINRYNFILTNSEIRHKSEYVFDRASMVLNRPAGELSLGGILSIIARNYIEKCSGLQTLVLLPNIDKLIKLNPNENIEKAITRITGFESTYVSRQDKSIPVNIDVIIENEPIGKAIKEKKITSNLQLDAIADISKKATLENTPFKIFLETKTTDSPDGTESLPDYFIPLKYIGDSLKNTLKEDRVYNIQLYSECDSRILKLWKKYGFISDDTRPVMVLGDFNTVQKVLYNSTVSTLESIEFPELLPNELCSEMEDILRGSKDYRIDLFKAYPLKNGSSSFREDVTLADELSLPEAALKGFNLLGTPIFRHNTRNSNVIQISINNNETYRTVYDLGFKKRILPLVINSNLKYYVEEGNKLFDSIDKILRNKILHNVSYTWNNGKASFNDTTNYDNILAIVTKTLMDQGINDPIQINDKKYKNEELAIFISSALFDKFNNGKPFVEIDSAGDMVNIHDDLMSNLNKLSSQVNLKTLPYFSIYSNKHHGQRALLIGITNSIVGFEDVKNKAWYTGIYLINGFRHVMNSSEMFSEFSLVNTFHSAVKSNLSEDQLNKIKEINTSPLRFK